MAELAFHTGLTDKLGYTCRLLRKAYRQGAKVQVRGDGELLSRLDPLLWTFEQLEFVPHLRLRAGQKIDRELARTPIWLVDDAAQAPEASVLVNLGRCRPTTWRGSSAWSNWWAPTPTNGRPAGSGGATMKAWA